MNDLSSLFIEVNVSILIVTFKVLLFDFELIEAKLALRLDKLSLPLWNYLFQTNLINTEYE